MLPSFLSKVLHGKLDFTADQLFLVLEALKLDEKQREYIELCHAMNTCGVEARKKRLEKTILSLQKRHLQASEFVLGETFELDDEERLKEYYRDHWHLVIHAALGIKAYQASSERLAKDLGLPPKKLEDALAVLKRIGLLEATKQGWKPKVFKCNLSRNSPLFESWYLQSKVQSLAQLQRLETKDYYNYAAVFSADEATKLFFQQSFLALLRKVQEKSAEAKVERVYQISFEIFPWT